MISTKFLCQKVLRPLLVVAALAVACEFVHAEQVPPASRPATRLTTRPTTRAGSARQRAATTRPASSYGKTLLRELPRQALLITAADQYHLVARDLSVDFPTASTTMPATAPEVGNNDLRLMCQETYDWGKKIARVVVREIGSNKEVAVIDLPVAVFDQDYPDYAQLATTVEQWCDDRFVPLLASAAPNRAKVLMPADPNLPPPPEVEALLAQVDPQSAFLAARLLHGAVLESGESPARLAALARAYAHLGESTRYLYSAHGSAFFARAMIYAERLARKYPDLALSHASRAYVYTLLGQPMEARRAFEKAHELAGAGGGEFPAWAKLAEQLNHFRTRELFDAVDGGDASPLASYFALLSVEHSGMPTLVINMSRLALKYNPGALRVINIMNDNSGVALQQETTAQATQLQFQLLSRLAQAKDVPETVQSAARAAAQKAFAVPELLELLGTMDRCPAEPGQLLPWSTYASVSRDALFVSGFRRIYLADHLLGTDPSERVAAWWPILKDHRFAIVIAGFDRHHKPRDVETVAKLREVDTLMIRERMTWLPDYVKVRNPAAWIDNYDYTSDDTAYDLAHLLWTYNYKEADAVPVVALIKGYIAKSLLIECPDHPSALADLIVNRWPETRARADQIERDMGAHPQVAYALARSYRSEGRLTDAVRLIQQVIEVAPDAGVYEELAELYKQQGDVDKWLDVYNKYLSSTEEFGLEHARKSEQIAYTLMRMKKLDRALPYAKAAAESYSGWGLNVYAHCLTEMGQYAQAEAIERACQERYPTGFAWYRWCQITGRGNLKDARALSESHSAEESDNDTAVYLQLDGQNDRAAACWEQVFAQKHDPYEALQLGMLDLEQGKPDVAKERFQRAHLDAPKMPKEAMAFMKNMMPPDYEVRLSIYRAAVHEVQRCLDDTSAVPNRDGEVKVIFDSKETPYPGNAEYFLGRLCELRGKKDDARWWYRTSLDSGEWTFSCRPQAAAGLRRLGEEYYK